MHLFDNKPQNLEPICDKWFKHFIKRRHDLICAYESGELSKREFLLSSMKELNNSNVRPFLIIDRLEKGIFNYQYYNALAKSYSMEAKRFKNKQKANKQYCRSLSLAEKYYGKKDETILAILKFVRYENVYGYFVHCMGEKLNDKLFEIVFIEYPEYILHSMSKEIYLKLCEHHAFMETKRRSKIENYINDRY